MGNAEEPVEAEVPRVRLNPKNPTSRERNKNMKILDTLSTEIGAACVEGRGVGGQHRIDLLGGRGKRKNDSDCCF